MKPIFRIALGSFLQVCAAVFPAAAQLQPPRPCEVARSWVQANYDRIPEDYQEFSQLPTEYRRAAFGVLDNDARSRLWKAQIESIIATRDHLTDSQRDVLIEALYVLTPDFFESILSQEKPQKARTQLSSLIDRAKRVFSRAEIADIFTQLGPKDREIVLLDHTSKEKITPLLQLPQQEQPPPPPFECSCSRGSDFCGNGAGCGSGSYCHATSSGCGWLWAERCDGLCTIVPA